MEVAVKTFLVAAHQCGFVDVNESEDGTVLWLRKKASDTDRETHQRMCIDSMTDSATVYWMSALEKVNSKTFRGVSALRQWFEIKQEIIVQR
jgi:hypothetical protein